MAVPEAAPRTTVTVAPGETKHAPHGGPGAPLASRSQRPTSQDPATFPDPTGREEEWRFTPLARLGGLLAGPAADSKADVEVEPVDGVQVEWVPMSDDRVGTVLAPADKLSALSYASAEDALVVHVPAETEVAAPVHVHIRAAAGTSYGHLVVDLGPYARATVVADHTGTGVRASNTEIILGEGATLTFVDVHEQDRDAVHAEGQAVRVGRDARLRHVVVTLGGDLIRITPTVTYEGPGGDAELSGLFLTDAGRHHEHQLFIDHGPPHCRSRVLYKGALQGEGAHSVWVGDVFIGPGADGTDTYELNRNLVLTDGARADSVPNLEIETGEVIGAGHASATGRFDDEQLFYCMARGIPEDEARRLVVRGFFADVLGKIDDEPLRAKLLDRVDALLDAGRAVPAAAARGGAR
ncbi:MAG TPA: Fe-S cluster assembly protein SufD [Mycobacteriales bacterium]